jgi:hypothetical protein
MHFISFPQITQILAVCLFDFEFYTLLPLTALILVCGMSCVMIALSVTPVWIACLYCSKVINPLKRGSLSFLILFVAHMLEGK